MAKYVVGCEGTQEEFYSFLLDLSQKIQWAMYPWEHPSVEAALYKKEASHSKEVETTSFEVAPSQPSQAQQVSPEDLRAKSIAFGKAGGQEQMKKFLIQLGVKKLSELDASQRVTMSALIDEASLSLKSSVLGEGLNA